jgi:hypothetical protein
MGAAAVAAVVYTPTVLEGRGLTIWREIENLTILIQNFA